MKHRTNKFNLNSFLDEILLLKNEFNIRSIHKHTDNNSARRIAILVNDCFLKHDGDIHWAGILERKIYDEIKGLNFACDPISYEINWKNNKHKAKVKNKKFNPLKLLLDKSDKYFSYHPIVVYLTNQVIDILSKEDPKEDKDYGRKNGKHFERGSVVRIFPRKQNHNTNMA